MDTKYVSLYDEDRLDELARDFERAEIREESIAEGLSQGIEQGIEHVAKKMLEENLYIEFISKITGINKEDIIALKKSKP